MLSVSGSIISPENSFTILAICLAVAVVGIRLEHSPIGRRISGAMIVVILSALLSNLGIIPASAPAYDFIWNYLVPLAIALFLINADMVTIFNSGGRILIAFAFGAMGVIAGSLAGSLLLDLGPNGAEYAAIFSATFTGGSLNFAAVADTIGFRNPSELAAAVAIDNILGLTYLVLLGITATWSRFQMWLPPGSAVDKPSATTLVNGDNRGPTLFDMMAALAVAAAVCALGRWIAIASGYANYAVLVITFIMIAVATLARQRLGALRSPELIAMMFMYLFFVVLGAGADFGAMFDSAAVLFLFVLLIIVTHILFTLAGAKLFRLTYAETIIASCACLGGPPIAVAFAALFGWRHLTTPGVVTGVFGYAIGNFIGVGVHAVLQQ